ncbi:hypothetical protein I4U23_016775 [Adineta vaga]|nr:hypothetical protein I4U23_016775 [Adineta vaga]
MVYFINRIALILVRSVIYNHTEKKILGHVVVITSPLFGHIIPLLDFAKRLSEYHYVTYIISASKLDILKPYVFTNKTETNTTIQSGIEFIGLIDGINDDYLERVGVQSSSIPAFTLRYIYIVLFSKCYLLFDCLLGKISAPPLGDTPLQAHLIFQKTHPLFWCVKNEFSRLFLFLHNHKCLQILVRIAIVSWICCIIGFGGIISRLITSISVFILSTTIIGIGKIGVRHRWYVPTWTILGLVFTKFKIYSVDYLITQYIDNRYSLEPSQVIFDSGFSSKFIQCISLYTLFAAGFSKIRQSGISWIFPGTLIFYLSDPSINNYTILPKFRNTIKQYIIKKPILVVFLAISSLIIELSSIFGIFFVSIRLTIVIIACLFHLGILFLLTPNFIPQCICYLMIIDLPFQSKLHQINIPVSLFDIIIISITIMILSGYLLSLFYIYEGWPFTSVPMFSLDRRQFTHDYLLDENQLNNLAYELPLSNGISIGCEDQFSFGNTWIRITKNQENIDLIKDICVHLCPFEFTFRHRLLTALIRSIIISRNEMNIFLSNIYLVLLSNNSQLVVTENDFLNVDIHFRNGWKTYSTTEHLKAA